MSLDNIIGYECSICGATYDISVSCYTCEQCGGNLDIVLEAATIRANYDPEDVISSTDTSLWRYTPLLPVEDPEGYGTPLRAAGGTPVFSTTRLAKELGLEYLWIKDESRNPSASFKDRASAVVVARALQTQNEVIVTASTGNAGAALACMAAAVGQKAVIFAPRTAPPAKIAQLLVYGADVLLVDGSYDQAFDLSIEASDAFGWYCRNTGYNPFSIEGKKTAAFEIWEALYRGMIRYAPDTKLLHIFVSVGDGNIISGLHKGFKDLQLLGWLEDIPQIYGVQAEGSAAIANAFNAGTEEIVPVTAKTLADSISVDLPRDGIRAVRAVRETGGEYITVADTEILHAIAALGKVGIFAEPAGAAAYAGLAKAVQQGKILPEDPVLVINTGSGLKDIKAAMQAVLDAPVIEPTLKAVKEVLEK